MFIFQVTATPKTTETILQEAMDKWVRDRSRSGIPPIDLKILIASKVSGGEWILKPDNTGFIPTSTNQGALPWAKTGQKAQDFYTRLRENIRVIKAAEIQGGASTGEQAAVGGQQVAESQQSLQNAEGIIGTLNAELGNERHKQGWTEKRRGREVKIDAVVEELTRRLPGWTLTNRRDGISSWDDQARKFSGIYSMLYFEKDGVVLPVKLDTTQHRTGRGLSYETYVTQINVQRTQTSVPQPSAMTTAIRTGMRGRLSELQTALNGLDLTSGAGRRCVRDLLSQLQAYTTNTTSTESFVLRTQVYSSGARTERNEIARIVQTLQEHLGTTVKVGSREEDEKKQESISGGRWIPTGYKYTQITISPG